MNSFSIFKQKALEKLGQVAITNDAVYSSLKTNITLLCDTVNGLRNRVNSLVTQYQEIVSLSCEMSRAIHGLYDGSGQALESASAANTANRKQLRDELLPALKVTIQDKVINDIEAWATQLDSLQTQMNSREESRVCLDHYKNKVAKIRATRNQVIQRGRSLSRNEAECLDRNERKLEKSRIEFQKINESCCDMMQSAWNKRLTSLNAVFVNLIQCEENLSALVNASVHACSGLVASANGYAIKGAPRNTPLTIDNSENKVPNVFDLFGATPPIVTEPTTPPSSTCQKGGFNNWSVATVAGGSSGDPFSTFFEQEPPSQYRQITAPALRSTQPTSYQTSIRNELCADWPT